MFLYSTCIGEFSRVYKEDDLAVVLSNYTIISMIAFAVAPCTPPIFSGLLIQIGWWRLTEYNFVAFLLAIIGLLITIVAYFKLTNLTRDEIFQTISSKNNITQLFQN